MNRQRTYLFLLIFLTGSQVAPAQTDSTRTTPNPVTIKMIRATVEFLATDKKFGQKPRVPCQPCQSYENLTRYVTQNKLMGADQLIIEARKKAALSSPAELRAYLLERVTGRGRNYRTKLSAFANYRQTLDAVAGGVERPKSPTAPPVIEAIDTTVNTDDTVVTNETTVTKPNTTFQFMPHVPLIALILSLISLVGIVTLFWQRSRDSAESVRPNLRAELDDLKKHIKELEGKILTPENKEKQPSNTVQSGQRLRNSSQLNPAQPPAPAPALPVSLADVAPLTPMPPPAYNPPAPVANTLRTMPTVQYGRTADLGDGFSVSGLVAAPDRDTVFEIHRQSDTIAFYQVSDQPELQRLALSDAYSYLNETCSYLTQPRPGSRIQTDKPGKLSLQGDKWAIIEKAQISFQ